LIDTEQERKIRLGKDYNYPALTGNQCYLNVFQKDEIGAVIGTNIEIKMQIENLYKSLVVRYNKDYAPIYGQPPIDLTSS
jgi:hypothetical protein